MARRRRKKQDTHELKWDELLLAAVNEPGSMLAAYSNFHNYSFGNCALAYFQAAARGIDFGPFATYNRWKELGRQVEAGNKAFTLCQPVMVDKKDSAGEIIFKADGSPEKRKIFTYANRWFFMAQTSGDELVFDTGPDWVRGRALKALAVEEVDFNIASGNTQGFAMPGRKLAINPLAQLPHKTLFHELGHIVLGHCDKATIIDGDELDRNIKEVEAEAVALICIEALGLDGSEFCRGYIQHWLKGDSIPETNAARIFTAASKILSAGTGKKGND